LRAGAKSRNFLHASASNGAKWLSAERSLALALLGLAFAWLVAVVRVVFILIVFIAILEFFLAVLVIELASSCQVFFWRDPLSL
jgi:hypothetical protein